MKRFDIPTEVSRVTDALEASSFKAFLVGGCVRDLLIDRTPKDWDVATDATPEEIQGIFGDDSFYENDFGTVGVVSRETTDETLKVVEVTPFRLEGGYSDFRRPDAVRFTKNVEDDLHRRDFTINAIALAKGKVVDPFDGQKDLKNKVIRCVGEAEKRFGEDALRMLRAVRLSAELGFAIDPDTAAAISQHSKLLEKISRERIRDEFSRIIMSEQPMIGLGLAERLGLLETVAPRLLETVGVEQGKAAHLYNVWEHSLRSLQHAADRQFPLEVRLAALFHDVAKPATKRTEEGQTTFYGHEVVGAKMAKEALENLNFPKKAVEGVTKLVRWHMFFSDPDKVTLSAARRLVARVGKESVWDLVNLRMCDRIGTGRPKEDPYRLRKYMSMIEEAMRAPVSVQMLKVNGEDLKNELGIEPGPTYGHVLHALLEEVLEDPERNTREYLLGRAKELATMPEKELAALGRKAREAKEDEEGRELGELRKKYRV